MKNACLVMLSALTVALGVSACTAASSSEPTSSSTTQSVITSAATLPEFALNAPDKPVNAGVHSAGTTYLSSLRDFSKKMLRKVDTEEENFVFSPLSVATCFSMAYEGAKGDTKAELAAMLGYEEEDYDPHADIQNMHQRTSVKQHLNNGQDIYLDVSESYFVDSNYSKHIRKEYLDTLERYYYAEAYHADLGSDASHELLAEWINGKTFDFFHLEKDNFKDFEGVLWLVNALYLKSYWAISSHAIDHPFTSSDGVTSTVPGIRLADDYLFAWSSDEYDVAGIPLSGGVTLRVMQEKQSSELDPIDVLLDPDAYLGEQRGYEFRCEMPKWSTRSTLDPLSMFESEIPHAINPAISDFSGMSDFTDVEPLYLSNSIHQAGIDVNELGIEGAAYTVIAISGASAISTEPEKMTIKLDHPFHYAVVTSEGYPLFLGKINHLA